MVGAVGLVGLSSLLAGARRTARRGRTARSELAVPRRETTAVSRARDDLADRQSHLDEQRRRAAASPLSPTREIPEPTVLRGATYSTFWDSATDRGNAMPPATRTQAAADATRYVRRIRDNSTRSERDHHHEHR
ncbi:hypothetical protein J2W56_006861 [Nocardia kruczakiae]|uniref:Uncharacterized protein n=1 Tax=Nocardia kruczakiae TaxID=261477 RepID=A0ABU1XRA5_9NOCA|nr:hypothetical protein [Nocardia kruczakiae]